MRESTTPGCLPASLPAAVVRLIVTLGLRRGSFGWDHLDRDSRNLELPMSTIRLRDRPAHKEVYCEAEADHLRHTRFKGLREDRNAKNVTREAQS